MPGPLHLARHRDSPLLMLAPLLIWAGYFLFAYVLVGIACARSPSAGFVPPTLWLAGGAAFLVTVLLGRSHARRLRQNSAATSERALALRTGLVLSVLSVIAIAWTALPTFFIHPCE